MATPHRRFKSLSERLSKNPRSIGKMFRRKSKSSLKDEDGAVTTPSTSSSSSKPAKKAHKSRSSSSASLTGHHKEAPITTGISANVLGENSCRVVVAIDFGTTYSGYAYAFRRKPDEIHLMRRKEAGQVGSPSHKIPTILLLDEREQFHAFGYDARDAYHDMTEEESRNWLYFEKFKMELHSRKVLHRLRVKKQQRKLVMVLWRCLRTVGVPAWVGALIPSGCIVLCKRASRLYQLCKCVLLQMSNISWCGQGANQQSVDQIWPIYINT